MKVAGLQKLTLLDFPERIACTVFLAGCNLRCPFCHNASLVHPDSSEGALSEEELLDFLQTRVGKLEGVCITGGEPTIHHDLGDLIRKIRALGFAIKLDTNGGSPARLASLLEDGLLDYVAMDIKSGPTGYQQACGGVDCLEAVRESVALLRASGVEHEFRTTLCHPLHTREDMEQIGAWLHGAPRYFLQQFVDSGNLLGEGMSPLDESEMEQMLETVLPWIPDARIRGI